MNLIGITTEQEQLRQDMLDFYSAHPEALLQIMKVTSAVHAMVFVCFRH